MEAISKSASSPFIVIAGGVRAGGELSEGDGSDRGFLGQPLGIDLVQIDDD